MSNNNDLEVLFLKEQLAIAQKKLDYFIVLSVVELVVIALLLIGIL